MEHMPAIPESIRRSVILRLLDHAGAGSWISQRRGVGTEDSQVNTLAGVAGTFAGVFSSPVVVVLLIMEVAHPGG